MIVDSSVWVVLGWVDDSSINASSIVCRLASTVFVTYIETRSYLVICVNAVISCECGAAASDLVLGWPIGVDLGLGCSFEFDDTAVAVSLSSDEFDMSDVACCCDSDGSYAAASVGGMYELSDLACPSGNLLLGC